MGPIHPSGARRWARLPLLVAAAVGMALAGSPPAMAICRNFPDCGGNNPVVRPEVVGVTPAVGASAGGTRVQIRVAGFTVNSAHPPQVNFGTSVATGVSAAGPTVLNATAPSHAGGGGTVDVRVMAPYVNATYPGGLTPVTGGDQFTYCLGACLRPAVSGISSASGPVTGGQQVTITGLNLTQLLYVSFGSTTITSFCSTTPGTVSFDVPASPEGQTGPVNVTVVTRVGASAPLTYTYTPAGPSGAHLDDNRNRFTLASLAHLNFLPSFITGLLGGISGRVIDNPAVHALYWDRSWDDANFTQGSINSALSSLIGSGYLTDAAQYGVGSPSFTGSDSSAPAFLCPRTSAQGGVNVFTLMYWITCEAGGGLQALTEIPGSGGIQGLPLPDGLPMADDNTDYAIFLPRGASVGLGSLRSCSSFDAFHFFTVVAQLRIGWAWFVPYPDPVYQSVPFIVAPTDCADDVQQLIENVSHELVESATDPLDGLGWIDNSKFSFSSISQIFMAGEASDLCEQTPERLSTIGGVSVSTYWSNSQGACVPAQTPSCSTTSQQLSLRPSTSLVAVKPRPLYSRSLGALKATSAYRATASMNAAASGSSEPAVSSHYVLWRQSGHRVSFEGETKVGSGPWTRFQIVQVGGKRCERGTSKWQCQTGLTPFDANAVLAELFTRDFAAPVSTSSGGRLSRAVAQQGNVAYSGSLTQTPGGAPVRLQSVARVAGTVRAQQKVVFAYADAGKTQITLPR